jgi:flagellar basal body-associated protein FliL
MRANPPRQSRALTTKAFTLLETVAMLVILVIFTMVVVALAMKAWKKDSAPPSSVPFQSSSGAQPRLGSEADAEKKAAATPKSPPPVTIPLPPN